MDLVFVIELMSKLAHYNLHILRQRINQSFGLEGCKLNPLIDGITGYPVLV
jgi:hypothetical protein